MDWKFWQNSGRKSKTREWVDAIVFAVIAATIIRTFFIEAFTIPTPSMEKTLMVGVKPARDNKSTKKKKENL